MELDLAVEQCCLPVLDFDDCSDEAFAGKLGSALEQSGFFYLQNHGIPKEMIEGVFRYTEIFHSSSLHTDPAPSSDKQSVSSTEDEEDFDEQPGNAMAFQINFPDGQELNRWPEEKFGMECFREHIQAYVALIDDLGRRLLPVAAKALNAPANLFEVAFREVVMSQSLTCYPKRAKRQMGLGEHRDDGFFTFIAQSDKPGLELWLKPGKWFRPQLMPGAILVNSGDALSRWTNGRWPSTLHRVVNVPGQTRFAIPLFWGPKPGFVVQPLVGTESERSRKRAFSLALGCGGPDSRVALQKTSTC